MSERPDAQNEQPQPAPAERGGVSQLWLILPFSVLAIWVGATLVRVFPHFRWESLPVVAAVLATALFALLLNKRLLRAGDVQDDQPIAEGLRQLLDSAGPAVVALDMSGKLIYCNPATERVLGYRASELLALWGTVEILAPGEAERLVAEMQKLCRVDRPAEASQAGLMSAYLECIRMLAPSMVPSFDAKVRRRDGVQIPVTLHISALRDAQGELTGMVAVAVDQSESLHREQAQRESQERYRDLFEHSSEMIATLSPAGQFLYANPAWKRCFGVEQAALLDLRSFEDLFSDSVHGQVAALFRRALDGEMVDRIPLRQNTPDGRVLELELSLSRRQKTGVPLAVRCLMRDVTQQKQRENRLALQLAVSQIVGDNAASESEGMRILEALCLSQGWDVAIEWLVGAEQKHLEFGTAWGVPGREAEALIQGSMGLALAGTSELPERAWKEGRAVWVADLTEAPATARVTSALKQDMISGWAVPVRAGSKVLAVLEFYCRFHLREDREAMAAIETAAASLGQLLARTQERGRTEELSRQQEVLLDAVAEGVCGLDRQGKVTFANPAAARLLGAPVDALIDQPVHDLLHGAAAADRACGKDCPLRSAASQATGASGEENIFRLDGTSFPAEYSLTPIRAQGRVSGSVLSFRDISQRYALDRMKDEFISTVSHELRTPLTSIRGALGLLSSGILSDTNEKANNLLAHCAHQLRSPGQAH